MNHSASALNNNLSLNEIESRSVIHYVVVSGHFVNLLSAAFDGHSVNQKEIICKYPEASYPSTVYQAKLLPTISKLILAVCAEEGLLIFDAETALYLFSHRLARQSNSDSDCFSKGVCCFELDKICFGTSYGEIIVLDAPRQGNIYKHRETLPITTCSLIWELICHKDNIMAGTSDGAIIILTFAQSDAKLQQLIKINGFGYPCTSLICFEDRILGSYGSGHLCLFDLKSGSLLCEVGAHARLINSLDLSRNDRMVLSAGEDAYVRLWRLSDNSSQIEHVCNVLVEDLLIQGAKFVGKDSSSFAAAGYDSHEIAFFKRS